MQLYLSSDSSPAPILPAVQPLLVTGATGTLGKAFQRICAIRGIETVVVSRAEMDITNVQSVEMALAKHNPWAVVNTAGYVRVDEAEKDFERCYRENTVGPTILAHTCAARGIQLLTFSSDLVFDGSKSSAYLESDLPRPLNVYGNSKRLAERDVLLQQPNALVVRTSAFFSPWDEHNFVYAALRAGLQKQAFQAADDVLISPTYVPDLVNVSLNLLIDEEHGVWHLANQGAYSWAELAHLAADMAGLDQSFVQPCSMCTFGLPAARPVYSVLGSKQGSLLPAAEVRLEQCVSEMMHKLHQETEEPIALAS